MTKRLLIAGIILISGWNSTFAQDSDGDYRTRNDGNWNSVVTWQVFNSSAWRDLDDPSAGIYENVIPSSASGVISILGGHDVTVPAGFSVTIDQTSVAATGSISVANTGALTMVNVASALVVNGSLIAQNGSSIVSSATSNVVFNSGSRYQHFFTTTQGVIPRATWNSASTMEIRGYTTFTTGTSGGNWNQTFGNVIWNCSAQTTTVNLAGQFRTVTGNLRILDTNTGALQLSSSQAPTINITGDFDVEGSSRLIVASTGVTTTVNIGGDFNFLPTNNSISQLASTGTTVLNIFGDFNMDAEGSTLNLANSTTSSGTGQLYIRGNFNLTSGTLKEGNNDSATSTGRIWFTNEGVGKNHTFNNTGTIANRIFYRLTQATDTLQVLGESQLIGQTGSALTVNGGVLILESEAGNGAIQTGSDVGGGNIRVATRTFATGSLIVYGGSGEQFIGNGQPTTVDVVINNSAGVSLNNTSSSNQTLSGLRIEQGDLTVENNNLLVNGTSAVVQLNGGNIIVNSTLAARTFTVNDLVLNGGNVFINGGANALNFTVSGDMTLTSGDIDVSSTTGDVTFTISGDFLGTGNFLFSGANNRVAINGTGDISRPFPINTATTLELFSLNRPGETVTFPEAVTVTSNVAVRAGNLVTNDLTVQGDLNVFSGSIVNFSNTTLELQSQFNNTYVGGTLFGNSASILRLTGSGSVGTLLFSAGGENLSTLQLDRPTSGTLVTLNSTLNIYDSLRLDDGIFRNLSGLTLQPNAVLARNSAASFIGVSPSGGAYNLVFQGTSLTPGLEAQGSLQDVTTEVSGTVTLGAALTLAGNLITNSGTFTSGANTISTGEFENNSTFNAPSTTLTLTGAFINNGTFNTNNGTINFNGTNTIGGDTHTVFNHIAIGAAGDLDAPALLEFAGNFTNSGIFTYESGETVRMSGSARQDISGNTTTFYNIDITNVTAPYSVAIEDNVNLEGVLTLAAGSQLKADGVSTTGVFTVLSLDDKPTSIGGSIGVMPATSAIIGPITVQRYMAGKSKAYNRYISSPVSGATVADITADYAVDEVKWYDETMLGAETIGYTEVTAAHVMVSGRGYLALPAAAGVTALWDVRGNVFTGANQGSVNLNITHTPSTPAELHADGWNLVGNPYPSPIGWGINAGWTRQNIGATITVRDLGGATPGYKTYTYNATDGTGTLPGGIIALGQSFWVYANPDPSPAAGDEAQLIVNENAKTPTNGGTFYRQRGPGSKQLIITLVSPDGAEDDTFLKVNQEATEDFDPDFDAYQFKNEILNIALLDSKTRPMLMHTIAGMTDDLSVPLELQVTEAGEYTIKFDKQSEFLGSGALFLVDDQQQVAIPINNANASYSFYISSSELQTSSRFRLSRIPDFKVIEGGLEAELYPNPVTDVFSIRLNGVGKRTVNIIDTRGKMVLDTTEVSSGGTINISHLPRGVYVVKIIADNKVILRKIVKE